MEGKRGFLLWALEKVHPAEIIVEFRFVKFFIKTGGNYEIVPQRTLV
jgi:hypothetical protein